MKVTVSFGNPFTDTLYTVSLLIFGWAIRVSLGSHPLVGVDGLPGHHSPALA